MQSGGNLRMKPRRARGVVFVLTAVVMSGCLSPYHPITPPEVAKLGCYDLTFDWHLGAPTFPEFLPIRLDSSPADNGRLMLSPPSRVGLHSHGGSWALVSADSLLLRFMMRADGQGIVVRLGGVADSLGGWARELHPTGIPATTPWFSPAHAARVECPKD